MRCRARIEKKDFPVRYSIRFRNPFWIPTASCFLFSSCFSFFFFFFTHLPPCPTSISIVRRGRSGTGYRTSVLSVFAFVRGLQIPRGNSSLDSSSRSIQTSFSASSPVLASWNPQHSNIPLGKEGRGKLKERKGNEREGSEREGG